MASGGRSSDDDRVRVTRPVVLASACLGLTVLAEVAAVVLSWGLRASADAIFFAVYNITLTAVGALIVSRLPHHPVGWIFCMFGVQGAVTSELAIGWGVRAVKEGWTGGEVAQWVGLVSWCPGALMWVLALLYTPTGQLPDRRWRVVVWAAVVGTSAYVVGWLFSPSSVNALTGELNLFAVDWLPGQELTVVGGTLLCLSAAGALASLVVRFRHADGLVRQQLKWVGFAGVLLTLLLPVAISLWSVSRLVRATSPLSLTAMTVALGAAVLRYRLFDVDLIILRSVGYVCVSVVVLAVYAAVSVFLGTVVGRSSAWQVAAATLAAAAVFRPALRAVRRVLDRRFDRDGHSARMRVDAFLERLRSGTEQPNRIQDVLREALRDPQLRLLLFLPASGGFADLRGRPAELDPGLAAVRVERDGVPEAVVQYLDTGDPIRQSRVRHLVEHARLALQVARLSVELNRQVDELDRSRARIAEAADEERRRIQRDLHDGAQQRLVTVGIGLRAIQGGCGPPVQTGMPIASMGWSRTWPRRSRSCAGSPISCPLLSSTRGSPRHSGSSPDARLSRSSWMRILSVSIAVWRRPPTSSDARASPTSSSTHEPQRSPCALYAVTARSWSPSPMTAWVVRGRGRDPDWRGWRTGSLPLAAGSTSSPAHREPC